MTAYIFELHLILDLFSLTKMFSRCNTWTSYGNCSNGISWFLNIQKLRLMPKIGVIWLHFCSTYCFQNTQEVNHSSLIYFCLHKAAHCLHFSVYDIQSCSRFLSQEGRDSLRKELKSYRLIEIVIVSCLKWNNVELLKSFKIKFSKTKKYEQVYYDI